MVTMIMFCILISFLVSVKSSSWSKVADLPQPKWENRAAEVNGLIYSVGGSDQFNYDWKSVFAYNLKTNTWSTVSPLTLPRRYHGTTVLNGFIYVCGGYYGETVLDSAQRYDPSTNNWTTIASLNYARQALTASTGSDHKIYAIGGDSSENIVEVYDPLQNQWSIGTPLLTGRSGHASVSSLDKNFIYVFGGYNSQLGYLSSMEVYSISSKQWTPLAPLHMKRFSPGGVVDKSGLIYALGGNGGVPCDGSVETYNPWLNQWNTTVPNMKNPRANFGAVLGSDQRIYIFGGECNYSILNSTEVLTLSTRGVRLFLSSTTTVN